MAEGLVPTRSVGTSDPISLPQCPFSRPSSRDRHWLRLVKTVAGFVRRTPHGLNWLRLGSGLRARSNDVFRNSTHPNWYWLRSGRLIHGSLRPLSRPILPRSPLASFGNCHWLRLVIWVSASFDEWKLASFGERDPRSQIGFVRGSGPSDSKAGVCRSGLSKNW
jgi:hypothetical protein